MNDTRPDAKMIEWLGFPEPPQSLSEGPIGVRLVAGTVALALILIVAVGILVGYFGFSNSGRSLLVDTALGVGLGTPLPAAEVTMGECDYAGSRAGSKIPGYWRCQAWVDLGHARSFVRIETNARPVDPIARGAGSLFGHVGIYWPAAMLAARWWNASLLLLISFGLIAFCVSMRGGVGEVRALSRARRGHVRSVDLLTWQGRPAFAYVDDFGTRRYARASRAALPLVLDGVRTTGAALVTGRSGVLLDAGLHPLALDPARRAAILERAGEIQRRCQIRSSLPPRPGDATTLAGRIGHIEQSLAALPIITRAVDKAVLARLYDDAWRLVWDSTDPDIANRALASRDAIAERLGPAAAWEAMQRCRAAGAIAVGGR